MRVPGRKFLGAGVLMGIGLLTSITLVPAAQAAPASAPTRTAPVLVTRTQVPMEYVGIDAKQAAKAGNRVVSKDGTDVLVDGRSGKEILRVGPAGRTLPSKGVKTLGTATGSCGSSFIELYWLGGANIRVDTGFDLNKTAVAWSWAFQVHASDSRGAFNWEWDDFDAMLGKKLRISRKDTTDMRGAYHVARVTGGSAVTATGGICKSGLPSDGLTIPR